MEQAAKPVSKDGLRLGMQFKKTSSRKLYCNDNYQYGLEIEQYLNTLTRSQGEVLSGELDETKPVVLVDLGENQPNYVAVEAHRATGKYAGTSNRFAIQLQILLECFEPIT